MAAGVEVDDNRGRAEKDGGATAWRSAKRSL
jgi:hypothetical protein